MSKVFATNRHIYFVCWHCFMLILILFRCCSLLHFNNIILNYMGCTSGKKHAQYHKNQEQKQKMKVSYIFGKGPKKIILELEKLYKYCSCGLSKDQPFCDDSHIGSKFRPICFKPSSSACFICQCKHIQKPPYCDDSHKRFQF